MFAPGFRLSIFDVVVLIAGAISSLLADQQHPIAGWALAFVVGHFFLFCNVFRISRLPEFIWAAVFVALAGATLLTETPGWHVTFAGSFLVATALIYWETKKPSYHGIAWRRINPQLRIWWESNRRGNRL